MKVFIWEYVEQLTDSYHSGGGCVVIAESIEKAYALLMGNDAVLKPPTLTGNIGCISDNDGATIFETEPTLVLDTATETQEQAFVFPDAGCC